MLLAIRLLDQKTVNKIAAGEVVESPKSVIKELTENAIDAGATTITTEIREGGISYIRVTDNGCGIPKAQVQEAFLRHATSKLSKIEDLEKILTMGFRGSFGIDCGGIRPETTTKTKDEQTGTKIEISGGEVKSIQDVACTEGTTVVVQNLFYNVPARRKFLKKPATESGYVSDLMNKLALAASRSCHFVISTMAIPYCILWEMVMEKPLYFMCMAKKQQMPCWTSLFKEEITN